MLIPNLESFFSAIAPSRVSIESSDMSELSDTISFYIKKLLIRLFQCQSEDAVGNTSFVWIPGIFWCRNGWPVSDNSDLFQELTSILFQLQGKTVKIILEIQNKIPILKSLWN